jgi:N-acetylglucosamine-6-phosphate deacetylase
MTDAPILLTGLTSLDDIEGPSSVLIADGGISALGTDAESGLAEARVLEANGLTAVPGFLELQLNGAFGHDFTSDPASMWAVGDGLARHGITAYLPTIVTSERGSVEAALDALARPDPAATGAVPLGIHVEGPFLSPERAGAHDRALLRDPDLEEVRRWADAGGVRILTLAPELPHGLDVIRQASARGIVVAVGHTDADAATAAAAVDAGARYATHLFNAMPPFRHRMPGAAGALLADARVTVGLILDRHHLDPIVVSLVERMAHGRVSLVSDAIAALGLGDGTHRLGGLTVEVQDGAARLPDGTLAGSATPLDVCVRSFAAMTRAPGEAIGAVTSVPARLLGLDDGRGALRVGGRADIVLVDAELEVQATIIGGTVAFAGDALGWSAT